MRINVGLDQETINTRPRREARREQPARIITGKVLTPNGRRLQNVLIVGDWGISRVNVVRYANNKLILKYFFFKSAQIGCTLYITVMSQT